MANISDLIGKILIKAERIGTDVEDQIEFITSDGLRYLMYHSQDCCENVRIEDIEGNLQDLVGAPIVQAEEVTNREDPPKEDYVESYTWTYYKLATVKGYVTIRWFGESNGYYSEEVDFSQA